MYDMLQNLAKKEEFVTRYNVSLFTFLAAIYVVLVVNTYPILYVYPYFMYYIFI